MAQKLLHVKESLVFPNMFPSTIFLPTKVTKVPLMIICLRYEFFYHILLVGVGRFHPGEYGFGGDFGPSSGKQDSHFVLDGILFPDRSPHPAYYESQLR